MSVQRINVYGPGGKLISSVTEDVADDEEPTVEARLALIEATLGSAVALPGAPLKGKR